MEKLLVTRKEAASILSISVDKLDELRNAEEIRFIRIGSHIYFEPKELRSFVEKANVLEY